MKSIHWFGLACIVATGALVGCGGDSPNGPDGTPTPTVAPTAPPTETPTPRPAATGTPAPTQASGEEEVAGPVASVRTRLYVVRDRPGGEVRDGPYYDPVSNNDVVRLGEFLVIDTTAFNAQGQKCFTEGPPQWTIENATYFELLGSSNPFQVRANARRRGVTAVYSVIDGYRSNVINIEVR